jgi:hypothetical protein
MDASGDPSAPRDEPTGVLVLHRPRGLSAGALRRIRVYLDGGRIVDLRYGATVAVPTDLGPHWLRAWCRPLLTASLPLVLAAGETLHLTVYISALDELEIQLDEAVPDQKPVA